MQSDIAIKLMTAIEAREVAEQIRVHLDDARGLILDLYERKGWKALGYGSWRECVIGEFDQSKSHLYRQLDAAKIEREISPIGEKAKPIPEGQLRPLKELPEGTRAEAYREAVEKTEGKPTAKAVQEVVDRKLAKPTAHVNGVATIDPPDIAKLRAAGKIHPDAIVTVVEPDPIDDEPEAIEPEETPEAFLESLPLRAQLSGRCLRIFEQDASVYRELEAHRKAFSYHAVRVMNVKQRRGGQYAHSVTRFIRTAHPKHWKACPAPEFGGCGGSGRVEMIGECIKCFGRGYLIF